ncbi:hypothetical protein GCM10027570_19410 [Streptomonospora sediminis]
MATNGPGSAESAARMRVLLYSDKPGTREQVRAAVGRRPAADVPKVEFVECATAPGVLARLEEGGIDVAVFDGETAPAGGMGVCRQIKDEIYQCPPVLLIIGRRDDGWLGAWSRADKVVSHPVDPVALAEALAELMRERAAATAALG